MAAAKRSSHHGLSPSSANERPISPCPVGRWSVRLSCFGGWRRRGSETRERAVCFHPEAPSPLHLQSLSHLILQATAVPILSVSGAGLRTSLDKGSRLSNLPRPSSASGCEHRSHVPYAESKHCPAAHRVTVHVSHVPRPILGVWRSPWPAFPGIAGHSPIRCSSVAWRVTGCPVGPWSPTPDHGAQGHRSVINRHSGSPPFLTLPPPRATTPGLSQCTPSPCATGEAHSGAGRRHFNIMS